MVKTLRFKKSVANKLLGFNNKQLRYFSWVCAVRAFPCLTVYEEKDYHTFIDINELCRTFYTLDLIYYSINKGKIPDYLYKNISRISSHVFIIEAGLFYNSCIDCILRMLSTSDIDEIKILASEAADHSYAVASFSSEFICKTATTYNESIFKMSYTQTLLDDIENIRSSTLLNSHISIYNDIWDIFMEALISSKCAYWAKLYKNIFESGFSMDSEACFRRLNIPIELQIQGASVVANYLDELEREGTSHLNEARIIILGEKGAGKTCLARRLKNPQALMTVDSESTIGVETDIWKIKKGEVDSNSDINVHIWDFAGHTITHAVHKFFLSERCLYILVYDSRTEDRNRLRYWLNQMKNYGGNSKAFILVNMRDQHTPSIPIHSLKERFNVDENISFFSIKNDYDSLELFREKVKQYIKSHPSWNNQEIPAKYFKVKEKLESRFKDGKEEITKEDFYEIALKYEVDKPNELLMNLNALGVCLYYQDLQNFNTLVLNPEWISSAVYKIINWVNEQKKYYISLDEFQQVFSGEDAKRFPAEKHLFLFQLIKYYEIAYEGRDKSLIIPNLLPIDRPCTLPEFPDDRSLIVRYISEVELLPDTISRFIVRHNGEIKNNTRLSAWRYGVVLGDDKDNIAMVREDDRTVTLSVIGTDTRECRLYFDRLRSTLNNLFQEYIILKPQLYYQIVSNKNDNNPLWMSEIDLMGHYRRNRDLFDSRTGNIYNVRPIIQNFYITNSNMSNTTLNVDSKIITLQDCTLYLQGDLNELVDVLKRNNAEEEAMEVANVANSLENNGLNLEPEDIKKRNIPKKIKRIIDEILNEDSKTNKILKKAKHGIEIAKNIINSYNKIANQLGVPASEAISKIESLFL